MTDDKSYRYTLINDTIPVRFELDGNGRTAHAEIVNESGELEPDPHMVFKYQTDPIDFDEVCREVFEEKTTDYVTLRQESRQTTKK